MSFTESLHFSLADTELNLENTVSACCQFVKLAYIVQVETGVSSIGSSRNSSVIIWKPLPMVTENQSNKSCPKSLYFSLYFYVCFQFVFLGYRICHSSQEITQFYRIKGGNGSGRRC